MAYMAQGRSDAYDMQLTEEICLAEILICVKVVLLKARKVVWCINEKNVLPKYHNFDRTWERFVILHNHCSDRATQDEIGIFTFLNSASATVGTVAQKPVTPCVT